MTAMTTRTINSRTAATDHGLAGELSGERDFACLASVSHLHRGDPTKLRRLPGVTGVIDSDDTADLQLIISAVSQRAAQRACVELVARAVPEAVVTVPEVVDYDRALLTYLERHGDMGDELADRFDDADAVAEALDRA